MSRTLVVLCLAGLCAEPLSAQPPAADETPRASQQLLNKLGTPRQTMDTFLDGLPEDQVLCLDLSHLGLTEDTRAAMASGLAYKLRTSLPKFVRIELDSIPDTPDHPTPYSLDEQAAQVDPWLMGETKDLALEDLKRIRLERSADGAWRFGPDTVDAIDLVAGHWDEFDRVEEPEQAQAVRAEQPFSIWLEEQFPERLRSRKGAKGPFYVAAFQWICLAVIVALGLLADIVVRAVLSFLTANWLRLRRHERDAERKSVWRPVGLLVQGAVWYYGTSLIGLPAAMLDVLLIALKGFTILAAVWTGFRLIDLMAHVAADRASKTDTRFDDIIVPMVTRSLKFVAVCVGLLTFAQAFGLPIVGLVGGLGVGGVALAFAAQDAASNFFGSLTVLFDRPFEVGDWVVTGTCEGEVETVGLRSTRIRTFYNSLVTLPNSQLTTATVDNMGRRRYRRIKTTLGLQYDTTPAKMDAFCEGIRELLRRHPYTRKDGYYVYFNDFSGSSLDVMLYCFLDCPDWSVELRERHRLLLDILRLAEQLQVSFAFPTQTVHLHSAGGEQPPPPDLSDAELAGRRLAAEIAPVRTPDEMPPVEFGPPTDFGET